MGWQSLSVDKSKNPRITQYKWEFDMKSGMENLPKTQSHITVINT